MPKKYNFKSTLKSINRQGKKRAKRNKATAKKEFRYIYDPRKDR